MKQFFTLSAALLCSIGAYAQKSQKPVNPLMPKAAKTVIPVTTPAKTTGADTRLIASANGTYGTSSWIIEDSAVVSYTGNNGWDYATEGWKFDTGTIFTYDQSTMSWDADGSMKQQIANNRIVSSLFREYTGSVWEDQYRTSYTYTYGLIATELEESNSGTGLEPDSRSTYAYNGDMMITENFYESWDVSTSQWQKQGRTLNHYNTAKRLDTTIYQSWMSMTSQWTDNGRALYTYNSNGQLIEMLQQNYMGSSWVDGNRTLYTYDANGRQSVVTNEHWTSSAWEKTYRNEYAYNTAGDMIEDKGSHWNNGAWEYHGKNTSTYNQYHHALTEESQSWDISTSQWYYEPNGDYISRNYYEAYTNDVKTVAANRAELKVFPVPAKEQITISASFQQAQPVSIIIRDMSGRVVKQVADNAGTQYRKAINVADLPAGSYMINISGTTEVASKMITVGN